MDTYTGSVSIQVPCWKGVLSLVEPLVYTYLCDIVNDWWISPAPEGTPIYLILVAQVESIRCIGPSLCIRCANRSRRGL